ncbi:hypothetical protein [Herbiconiux liangxiaofengii]|uniref:hypothetical protein n=1 Tax=Herbiconiux liangxiaofengii TaxID=3342795 RepID=UPI0035BA995A
MIPYDVVALEELRDPRWQSLRERVEECLIAFCCERSSHLQDFARTKVMSYERDGHSRTYVVITPTNDSIDVAGFFTIGMTQLDLSKAAKQVKKKLTGIFSHTKTGAYSIAELARDDRYTSEDLPGSIILDEAFAVIKQARKFIGGRFLVVDARDVVMERLYKPAGFQVVGVATPPRGMEDVEFATACCQVRDL